MAGEKVLVVDDNPINLKLVRVLLSAEGYDVRTATDGVEALTAIMADKPRIVLMDLQMPGMDGLDVTRTIKNAAETNDIVVIAVTAYAMKGDAERALLAGCDGYIAKPINTRTLAGTVARFLNDPDRASGEPAAETS